MNNRVDDIFIDAVTVNIVNSFNTLFCILNISIIITVIIPSNMKLINKSMCFITKKFFIIPVINRPNLPRDISQL